MYKNRNTGTGNRMRGTWGMEGILYPGNVRKHSRECPQTFRGMSSNIPGMSEKIPRNVAKNFEECPQTFQGMSPNIPGNVVKHFRESGKTFRGTFFKHSLCSE